MKRVGRNVAQWAEARGMVYGENFFEARDATVPRVTHHRNTINFVSRRTREGGKRIIINDGEGAVKRASTKQRGEIDAETKIRERVCSFNGKFSSGKERICVELHT